MHIEQLYTGCLSEAAYYIESNGEAAIIDPMRDIETYLDLAEKRGTQIKYVFETHFHADFVSGHLDLSKATGAPIIYGPQTKANFAFRMAKDREQFPLGDCLIEVVHTPGHTLESSCFLLKDKIGKDFAIFTGDTLFVGDVGRPDLAQKGEMLATEDLAGMLYESLQNKILPLADDIIVYPAHGAGSSCGKNIGTSTQSTIGEQKQTNYALQPQSKEDFVKVVIEGLPEPPQYFSINAAINKNGYDQLDEILQRALHTLSAEEVKDKIKEEDVWVIDTRNKEVFAQEFIPESIFIGLDGRFAEWAGSLISFDKKLILVTEPGMEREAMVRLARVGFDKMIGYLDGGFDTWKNAGFKTDMIIEVEVDELAMDIPFDENLVVVDVRKEIEFADGHVKDAVNIPLSSLTDPGSMSPIEDTDNIYLHCQSGYRSIIAASMIKKQGIHNIRNIVGGWKAISQEKKIKTAKSPAILN